MSKSDPKVEIFHRINKLKLKAGLPAHSKARGVIEQGAVDRAEKIIEEKEQEYPVEVKDLLGKLEESWKNYLETSDAGRAAFLDQVYNFSNNIKDISGMYRHDLMHHFSLSLRDFCEKIDIEQEAHQVIVQAHLDVMWITYDEKLRKDDSEKAEELKLIVAKAIEKHS